MEPRLHGLRVAVVGGDQREWEVIAALRQAVIYQGFLDAIEPSERIYHEQDPAEWLRRAVSA